MLTPELRTVSCVSVGFNCKEIIWRESTQQWEIVVINNLKWDTGVDLGGFCSVIVRVGIGISVSVSRVSVYCCGDGIQLNMTFSIALYIIYKRQLFTHVTI